jgi:DNA repair protein RecN (Recombination protein N)
MPRTLLHELSVSHLGVIEAASVQFDAGLTVLTGETGAGKTLLVEALTLCLGGDARSPRGQGDLSVSAVFSQSDGSEISLGRQASGGRLRGLIDGQPVSAEALALRGSKLLAIHGQHESVRLRQKSELLRILDAYGGIDLSSYVAAREQVATLERERSEVGGSPAQRERDLDYARHQLHELETAALHDEGELEDVVQQLADLTAVRDRLGEMLKIVDMLDGDSEDAVLTRLAIAGGRLPQIDALESVQQRLGDALATAREAVADLRALADPEALDGDLFSALEHRVGVLQSLVRKYGGSITSALEERERLRIEVQRLEGSAERLGQIEELLRRAVSDEAREAARVASLRETAARRLEVQVSRELSRVALGHATLQLIVRGTDGGDVEMLFCPNPGAAPGPLHVIASGGELSRVLLALSLVTTREDVVAVFDEVDAGIGGGVAQSIGECLTELSGDQQVIVVTHLATVAARAHRHYVVEKKVANGRTTTQVREVSGEERVREIARMLSGETESRESLALAQRMLGQPPGGHSSGYTEVP